ncbi:MAG: aminopeptidase N [Candidatus Puniceispirillum sp.]|nr:aminopeptidase N [Candidatus Puniceispirillum sp.]MBL6774343.1 aminopeptidase N [Candidatus Puniceispirillum sp.]
MLKRREDYMPPAFLVTNVDLNIDIHNQETMVTTKLQITPNPAVTGGQTLQLDGRDLTLHTVTIDGKPLAKDAYRLDQTGLYIDGIDRNCVIETIAECHPETNTALEGLYLSGGMYCTQCEPEGFRRIGFYPDRPDVMSIFTVRLEAAQRYPQLLSNGNLVETGDCGNGRQFAIWHDPHPKPSYLFAAVAGDLDCAIDHFVTMSGRRVDLHIYVEKGNLDLTHHAMDSLKRSMRWDEEVYGLEYDLDLFQIVAVSHFNMGAMENKGLNIFNSKFVLADSKTATDTDLHRVESIIAHEYFHNWTGNRVTCRDWFQLTLKEGLTVFRDQCFSADMHDSGLQRADDVSMLRAAQFPEDRSPTAHPIRPESYREINNFYTATVYEKGAEVIRMLAGYLGQDGFRRGTDLYFERHDGDAVTCDDFITALADANSVDLTAFSGWYSQAGTPELTARRVASAHDTELAIEFTQTIPDTMAKTPRLPLPIPVRIGLVGDAGEIVPFCLAPDGPLSDEQVILISEAVHLQPLYPATASPVVPSLLRNFSAPVILKDDLSSAERLHLMAFDADMFNRWDAAQTLLADLILAVANDPAHLVDEAAIAALAKAYANSLADPDLLDMFKSGLLTLPAISVLESRMQPADPVALFNARRAVEAGLGRLLAPQITAELLSQNAANLATTAGGRALLNRLLALGVAAGDGDAINQASAQVHDENMTLSQGALAALNHCNHSARGAALQVFHDRWQHSPLVMEKWFMMEAMSSISGTVRRLGELMAHPAFDPNNPNKLRSVLGAFMTGNPLRFYAEDGSGFDFIGDCLIDIDARNAQLAARMALPLTRMAHYAPKRRAQMSSVLQKLQKQAQSNDLREVVDKALADLRPPA